MKAKIVIVDLFQTSTACPSQWEGETDKGEFFYARYRGGYFRAGIAASDYEFFNAEKTPYNIINKKIGDRFDGCMDTNQMMDLLKDKIDFTIVDLTRYIKNAK